MTFNKSQRFLIGILLLILAFILVVAGAHITWGLTGALFAAGITTAVYGCGFLGSTAD